MKHFDFESRVHLNCRVVGVSPVPNLDEVRGHGHIIHYFDHRDDEDEPEAKVMQADYVAVCSGLHVTPAWPDIPGIDYVVNPKIPVAVQDSIEHQVYHSADYKSRAQLAGRSVMILGTGETGHDLAYEAVKAGATQVTLCTRGADPHRFSLDDAVAHPCVHSLGGFLSFPKVLVGHVHSPECRIIAD